MLNFIASAFDVPNSYPLAVPQLAEFYVHYHLLHFTRHYYKLPTAPGQTVAACSKGHIRVSRVLGSKQLEAAQLGGWSMQCI